MYRFRKEMQSRLARKRDFNTKALLKKKKKKKAQAEPRPFHTPLLSLSRPGLLADGKAKVSWRAGQQRRTIS